MKKILIYLFLIILVAGSIYFYKDEKDTSKETNDKTTNIKENKTHEEIKCIADYECIMKDNKKYYFSNRTSIDVNNMYNYVTDEMEAGTLKIENGTLEFVSLDNKVLKTFDNVKNAKYIESNTFCSETYYVVLTSDNKVYRTDVNISLFLEEPFYQIELDYNVKGISLNDGENTCINDLTVISDKDEIKMIKEN